MKRAAAKFTFKTEKSTGRYRSFNPDTHLIKLNGGAVGTIGHESPHRIMLHVIDNTNPNCDFRNAVLFVRSTSLEEAKLWLNNHFEAITSKFNLKRLED